MERDGSFLVDEICENVLTLADKVQVEAFLSQCQRPRRATGSHWHLHEHAKAGAAGIVAPARSRCRWNLTGGLEQAGHFEPAQTKLLGSLNLGFALEVAIRISCAGLRVKSIRPTSLV